MGNVDSWLKTARLDFSGQQHGDLSFVPCRISKAVADTLESSYSLNEPIPGSGKMTFAGALIGHCGQKCKDSMQKGETDTKLSELIEEGRQFWRDEIPIETQIKDNFSLHSFSPSTTIELVRSHFPTECYDSHLYHFPGKRLVTSELVGSKYKSTVNQPSAFYTKWKTALTNQFNQLEWPEQENFRKMISAKLTDRLQKVNPFLNGTIRKVIVNTEKRNCVSDRSRYCAYYSSQKDSLAFRFEVVFDASQGTDETNVSNSIESQFTWKEKLDGKSASKAISELTCEIYEAAVDVLESNSLQSELVNIHYLSLEDQIQENYELYKFPDSLQREIYSQVWHQTCRALPPKVSFQFTLQATDVNRRRRRSEDNIEKEPSPNDQFKESLISSLETNLQKENPFEDGITIVKIENDETSESLSFDVTYVATGAASEDIEIDQDELSLLASKVSTQTEKTLTSDDYANHFTSKSLSTLQNQIRSKMIFEKQPQKKSDQVWLKAKK